MSNILVKGGRVFDGHGFLNADVLIKETKVVKIGEKIEENADFIFDANGKTVLPGLVDIHMHMRGISPESWGIDATSVCIPHGVTAAADASATDSRGDIAFLENQLVKSRVFVYTNGSDKESVKRAKEKFGKYAVGLKTSVDKITAGVSDISQLRSVIKIAEELKLPLTVHSTNSPYSMRELVSELRRGDILTHAYHGGENTAAENDFEALRIAKKKGIIVDAGMAGNVHTDFSVFKSAISAGVFLDVISTDITKKSAYKRGGDYGLPMCMSISRYLGMREEDIFRAVTSNAAAGIGMSSECGKLREGGVADLCVLEYSDAGFDLTDNAGNHIESKKGYKNILTVANGEVVYRRI